ncbi:Monocarboxylate transporter 10 [Exaiptasia diaphana]|nr:Monocarboxylate transporter 10 [Exaiptasia diaphana]
MGPGAGVFVMTPIAQTSLDMIGWRYTFVVLSGFALMATLLSCTFDPAIVNEEACYDDDIGQQMVNREVDVPFWKNPAWTVMTLSTAIISFGAPAPQVHMVRYCEELGYTSTKGSKLYIYFGAASLIFRVTTGKFLEITKQSQWAKPQYFYQVSVFIIGITTVLCPLSNNFSWLTLYFTLFGCADGCFCTCMNVVILNTVTEKQRDQSYGFWLGAFAIPMALGPTVAGFMADAYGTYKPAFYMTGSVIILSGLVIFILLFWKPHQPECNEILLESTSIIVERETVV